MNTTTYKKPIPSPFHSVRELQKRAFDVQDQAHPAREEIERCVRRYEISAIVEQDDQTLTTMKNVPGLVAFLCTLVKDGRVIAQGRGSAILNSTNRFIQRTVHSAFNSALADACIRATKVLNTFCTSVDEQDTRAVLNEAYSTKERATAFVQATEKQRQYLWQLIQVNVDGENERDGWQEKITEMSKNEASEMIASFKR